MTSAVLATLSGSYPPLEGRSPTCYSAVRHGHARRRPFDLHVLGTPPAFILSQDQTLHRNCQEPLPLPGQMASDDLQTDRHAPHHSSIVNVLATHALRCPHRRSGAEGHLINPSRRLSRSHRTPGSPDRAISSETSSGEQEEDGSGRASGVDAKRGGVAGGAGASEQADDEVAAGGRKSAGRHH
jgi:hypothetical protein